MKGSVLLSTSFFRFLVVFCRVFVPEDISAVVVFPNLLELVAIDLGRFEISSVKSFNEGCLFVASPLLDLLVLFSKADRCATYIGNTKQYYEFIRNSHRLYFTSLSYYMYKYYLSYQFRISPRKQLYVIGIYSASFCMPII